MIINPAAPGTLRQHQFAKKCCTLVEYDISSNYSTGLIIYWKFTRIFPQQRKKNFWWLSRPYEEWHLIEDPARQKYYGFFGEKMNTWKNIHHFSIRNKTLFIIYRQIYSTTARYFLFIFFLILLKNELDYAKIIGLILYHGLKIRCCKKEDFRNWRRTENVFGTLFRKAYRSIRVCAVYNKIPYWIMLTFIFTKYYLSLHYKWWLPNFK